MLKALALTPLALLTLTGGLYAAQVKTYQVTGPVTALTNDVITVQKGKDLWEIGRDSSTKVSGDLKVALDVCTIAVFELLAEALRTLSFDVMQDRTRNETRAATLARHAVEYRDCIIRQHDVNAFAHDFIVSVSTPEGYTPLVCISRL